MKARIWSVISLLLFVAAVLLWLQGNRYEKRNHPVAPPAGVSRPSGKAAAPLLTQPESLQGLASTRLSQPSEASSLKPGAQPGSDSTADTTQNYRLANTTQPLSALAHSSTAVLLRNAFIDTASGESLAIPDSLRSQGDPGTYIVQARGAMTVAFRSALAGAGAKVVSYIPNNALLVRMDRVTAERLTQDQRVQAVLPYEPYYKLSPALLRVALEPAEQTGWLTVTGYPGEREALVDDLKSGGLQVLGEGNTPFGPQVVVAANVDGLSALAQLGTVQLLERHQQRMPLNDLTRTRMGTVEAGSISNSYLGLSGSNIWVNINDSGVEASHPDLKGRVFGDTPVAVTDTNGHGTFMAGVIASSGANGPIGTNASGSEATASFQGMAPAVKLLSLPIDLLTGPTLSDEYLITTAARSNYVSLGKTNLLISNNSWGYPENFDYDSSASTYDAAVRDALPDVTGSQQMLYVFAAGNSGAGNESGFGGEPGSITSPGTAKNVITVGAIDQPRNITNEVIYVSGGTLQTNTAFLGETDSQDEVAPFSSRGNVGIGLEGVAGRFKPDVVAPGAFVVSTRSSGWNVSGTATNASVENYPYQTLVPGEFNDYGLFVSSNATRLVIEVLSNNATPRPMPPIPIYVKKDSFPDVADFKGTNRVVIDRPGEGNWFYSLTTFAPDSIVVDLRITLEIAGQYGNYFTVLSNLNNGLKPYYRYESGSSVSAAAVSGMLALMQEFFERQKYPYSATLFKALVINGARSLGPQYGLQVDNPINYQGWGLPTLTSILPASATNTVDTKSWPIQWVDQSPTNALVTGQSHFYEISIPEEARNSDLKVTLVWTDPPANPAAGYKLVNNLDLVVSNKVTGELLMGNYISKNSDYNLASLTNDLVYYDSVNNVENVLIRRPVETNYAVFVIGRQVNVNAVTAHTNGIAQDYSLVVSTVGDTNAISLTQVPSTWGEASLSGTMTNAHPMLYQHVGANSPLTGGSNGTTNQWRFYVFTNIQTADVVGITNGPYVAFATFMPVNMSKSRNREPDLDLYVTRGDARLLDLDPAAITASYKARTRGGTETVAFTNAAIGEVFYVGVKSEDQMGGEFQIVGLSSEIPFEQQDEQGNTVLNGMPFRVAVPDGSTVKPEAGFVFAIGISSTRIQSVRVMQEIVHDQLGDLHGNLSHNSAFTVLNNHTLNSVPFNGVHYFHYADSRSTYSRSTQPTDGPGSLMNFDGDYSTGSWILSMVDNSLGHTGLVQNLKVVVEPAMDLFAGSSFYVLANEFKDLPPIDVPADASALIVTVTSLTGPLDVYLRYGSPPNLTQYDKMAKMDRPGGTLTLTANDTPPLRAGKYYLALYNPSATTVNGFVRVRLERNLSSRFIREYRATNIVALGDDVLTIGTNAVGDRRVVSDLKVGLRINHPRASDLSVHLVGPDGSKVLLSENRGGTNRTSYGYDQFYTNFHHVALTFAGLSASNGVAALYLDGELQKTQAIAAGSLQTSYDLLLGRKPRGAGTASQYLGMLDEVDLYSRALNSAEIRGIFKYGGGGKPTNSLVSRWPLDGSATDSRPAGNNGEVSGGVYVGGKFGQAFKISAAGEQIRITNHSGLNVGTGAGFTLDAWINPANLSLEQPIAVWSDGTNRSGVELYLRPGTDTNTAPGLLCARLVDLKGTVFDVQSPQQGLILTNGISLRPQYSIFTEDTNIALVPIKFASDPAAPSATYTNQLLSGFESVAANKTASFRAGDLLEGWTVSTGSVSVLQTPALAHTGTNLLVLDRGALVRTLPTVPGRAYRVQFSARQQPFFTNMISWWSGEVSGSSYLDILSTNHASADGVVDVVPAKVGDGFGFTRRGFLKVASSASLNAPKAMTIEMWMRMDPLVPVGGGFLSKLLPGDSRGNYSLSARPLGLDLSFNDPASVDPSSDSGGFLELSRYGTLPTTGAYHHVAGTLRQVSASQIELATYLDGALVKSKTLRGALTNSMNSAPLLIGAVLEGTELFGGILDEVSIYDGALDASQIQSIYALDSVGKARPPALAGGTLLVNQSIPLRFFADGQWRTNGISFVATTNQTRLDLQGVFSGAMVDSVEMVELVNKDYLPEETLADFIGKAAIGNWRLEVVDVRTGITNPIPAELISWTLQLYFAPPVIPAITLTNGIPYTNVVDVDAAKYFIVEVPRSATRATNTLMASTGLDLIFNQNGVPMGDLATSDIRLLTNATLGISVITTNGTKQVDTNGLTTVPLSATPQLVPGQRYYLAVTNATVLNTFVMRVDFDAMDTNVAGLTPLGFGETIRTNIAVTNALHYYRYNVTTGAVTASFEVYPTNGNVNLYIRRAEPVPDPLPRPTAYDYASEKGGTNAEVILVGIGSSPVSLSAGDWYIGVANFDSVPVDYSIRVVESTSATSLIIPLSDGVPVAQRVVTGDKIEKYFLFTVADEEPAIQFDLYNLTGRARVLVQLDGQPTTTDFFVDDLGAPGTPSRIVLRAGRDLPSLVGDWYLKVIPEGASVNFSIKASILPAGIFVTPLANGVWQTNTIASDFYGSDEGREYYSFTVVDPGALYADFELAPINADGNVDLLLRKGSLPTGGDFDYAGGALGTTPELIRVRAGSGPVPLTPGEWFLAVLNTETTSVTYRVRATELTPTIGTLVNGVPQPGALAAPSGTVYYKYTASPTANRLVFALTGVTGNLEAYVRYGLPLPDASLNDYSVSTTAGIPAQIRIGPGSLPPAQAGDWYLAVRSPDSGLVMFTVVASEVTTTIVPMSDGVATNGTVRVGDTVEKVYALEVTNAIAAIQFDLFNLTGKARLLTQVGTQPTLTDLYAADPGSPEAPGRIVVRTNSALPSLVGTWYMTVFPEDLTVDYSIKATVLPGGILVQGLENGVWFTNTAAADPYVTTEGLNHYKFTVVDSLSLIADFESEPVNGNVNLLLRKGDPASRATNDYRSELTGLEPDLIRVRAGGIPVSLGKGDWYLAVENLETNSVTYRVRASELSPTITELKNGVEETGAVAAPSGRVYYRYVATTNANYLNFSITGTGRIQAYLKYELPLPDSGISDYAGYANAGIPLPFNLTPTSVPVPAKAGVWYLTIESPESGLVTYTIKASESKSTEVGPITLNPSVTVTPVSVTLSWTADPGLSFQVEYSSSVIGPWTAVTKVITSSSGSYNFTDDGSQTGGVGVVRFYRVVLIP